MEISLVRANNYIYFYDKKYFRCPKFDGDAKQTLEIRVERKWKRNNRENEGGYLKITKNDFPANYFVKMNEDT